jgi:hypothetical protein
MADRFHDKKFLGEIEIHAYTKHGPTSILSVMPPTELSEGDTLKTDTWILGAKEFVVLKAHTRPMKLPGVWYEVRVVKAVK